VRRFLATIRLAVAVVAAFTVAGLTGAAAAVPDYIAAAIADPHRPAEDTAQDGNRKPAAVLAFAGVKPGDTVIDLMPGTGYYTRLFSLIVGPKGRVIALQPAEMDKAAPKGLQSLRSFAEIPPYENVTVLVQPIGALAPPDGVDLVWTSQNYHDLHDPFMGSPDLLKINQLIFESLKPGGLYVVLDHRAPRGSGTSDTDTLHRIDPAAVRSEVLAAGFKLAAQSDVLRNREDDDTRSIYDKSIRGRTDRFIFKFRKPRS
jgi:predicted methyltransferase